MSSTAAPRHGGTTLHTGPRYAMRNFVPAAKADDAAAIALCCDGLIVIPTDEGPARYACHGCPACHNSGPAPVVARVTGGPADWQATYDAWRARQAAIAAFNDHLDDEEF